MRKRLLASMEKKNISQRYVADSIGVSVGVINKFFTKEKEIAFDIVWKICKLVDSENTVDLMEEYAPEVTDARKDNVKMALEYYSINRRLTALSTVIDTARLGSAELQEWARIYALFLEYQLNTYKINEEEKIIRFFRRIDSPYKESRLILYFFELYAYYYANEYRMLYKVLVNLPSEIIDVEHPFIRRCLLARVDELMCMMALKYKNNPKSARIYCERVLDHDIADNFNAMAHFIKGLSYLTEDFDKCVQNFQLCLDYYERIGRQEAIDDMRQQIEFAHVLWDKETEFTSELHRLMFEVKQGKADPDVLTPFKSVENTPFIFLIKGIAMNDSVYLRRSFNHFKDRNEFFRANLAAIELIKRGDSDVFLQEALSN